MNNSCTRKQQAQDKYVGAKNKHTYTHSRHCAKAEQIRVCAVNANNLCPSSCTCTFWGRIDPGAEEMVNTKECTPSIPQFSRVLASRDVGSTRNSPKVPGCTAMNIICLCLRGTSAMYVCVCVCGCV